MSQHSKAHVYPDGEIYNKPQANKSDDYFIITDCDIEQNPAEVFDKVRQHFGEGQQAFNVARELFTYEWMI